jgi:hypothetical protein
MRIYSLNTARLGYFLQVQNMLLQRMQRTTCTFINIQILWLKLCWAPSIEQRQSRTCVLDALLLLLPGSLPPGTFTRSNNKVGLGLKQHKTEQKGNWCVLIESGNFFDRYLRLALFPKQKVGLRLLQSGMKNVGLVRTVYLYAPYMTVYLVISLPKLPHIHRIHICFWPTLRLW